MVCGIEPAANSTLCDGPGTSRCISNPPSTRDKNAVKTSKLLNVGVLLLSTVISISLAEIAVRLFVPVRDVGPSFTVYDSVFGKRLKAAFRGERVTPEFRMRISTNSGGFRGPEPEGPLLHPIVFLGDSFTLGYGVSDGDEFPARVEAALRRVYADRAPQIVNAGIGDTGNGYWIKFLRGKATTLQPRLVVMQVFENDFYDNISEKLFEWKPGEPLRELPVPEQSLMRRLQGIVEAIPGLSNSYLVGLFRQLRLPTFGTRDRPSKMSSRSREDLGDQLTIQILSEAISICQGNGWKILGLLVGLQDAHYEAVRNLFAHHGVTSVAIPAKSERPELYYKIDGHWNAYGHAFTADRVLEVLGSLAILDP